MSDIITENIGIRVPKAVPEKELQEIEKTTNKIITEAQKIEVKSSVDVKNASVFLKKIKDTLRHAEDIRTSFTKPINEALRNINGKFKEQSQPLLEAKATVSNKILIWKREEEARIAELERRRKIQEAQVAKGKEARKEIEVAPPEPSTIGHVQVRKVWTFAIEDFNKIPNKYKVIDRVKVNGAIRGGIRKIAGLKIYQQDRLATV